MNLCSLCFCYLRTYFLVKRDMRLGYVFQAAGSLGYVYLFYGTDISLTIINSVSVILSVLGLAKPKSDDSDDDAVPEDEKKEKGKSPSGSPVSLDDTQDVVEEIATVA